MNISQAELLNQELGLGRIWPRAMIQGKLSKSSTLQLKAFLGDGGGVSVTPLLAVPPQTTKGIPHWNIEALSRSIPATVDILTGSFNTLLVYSTLLSCLFCRCHCLTVYHPLLCLLDFRGLDFAIVPLPILVHWIYLPVRRIVFIACWFGFVFCAVSTIKTSAYGIYSFRHCEFFI